MQDFRRLRVWRYSHDLAVSVRKATRRFPRSGFGSMRDQLVRAAESIPSNIAEGCGASTQKEFGRYLNIGIKSASELESQLELARDNGVLREQAWVALTDSTVQSRRMLFALRKKVMAASDEEKATRLRKPKIQDPGPAAQGS